jgi:hypothetical protein
MIFPFEGDEDPEAMMNLFQIKANPPAGIDHGEAVPFVFGEADSSQS